MVVNCILGTALLFEADTYFGSIRIFRSVLELGSISEAFVSGGMGGFAGGPPTPGEDSATLTCGLGGIPFSSVLVFHSGGLRGVLDDAGEFRQVVGDVRAGATGSRDGRFVLK